MVDDIRLLVTGGTFDKKYDEIKGELCFVHTHVDEMVKQGRFHSPFVTIETIMLTDSQSMTESHRLTILDKVKETSDKMIVITHGTDSMVETAKFLDIETSGSDKTIVLTGAMIPYSFRNSDGLFNLGAALSLVQVLEPGTYISMHGTLFNPHEVMKDPVCGEFVKLRRLKE